MSSIGGTPHPMNCRDSESLILAERDGALSKDQLAALSDHVAACPGCATLRANLARAMDACPAALAPASIPDAETAWREVQQRLHARKRRPPAPVIWFAAPLAAAAALALVWFSSRPAELSPAPSPELAVKALPAPLHDPSFIAGADFVEAGDPEASVVVFVDQESGWLVVWASSPADATSG